MAKVPAKKKAPANAKAKAPRKAKSNTARKTKAVDSDGRRICGAKTRQGGICRNNPMESGRCRLHGGASKGAPKGNQNARKHGLYSEYFTEEEAKTLDTVELGKVDDELKLCRIKLRRWLKFENETEQALIDDPEAGMLIEDRKDESISVKQPDPDGKPGESVDLPGEKKTIGRKRINIEDNIDRLLRRIESLERTRKLLLGDDGDSDFEAELEKLLDGDSQT